MLLKAAEIAERRALNDSRSYFIGCIGIRQDGAIVSGKNGAVKFSDNIRRQHILPTAHAEGRVLAKLGKNSSALYVSRVARKDGSLAMARPCKMCRVRIKAMRVNKVFYSIDNDHYGIWFVEKNYDKIFEV